jgi:hypothetical protein
MKKLVARRILNTSPTTNKKKLTNNRKRKIEKSWPRNVWANIWKKVRLWTVM